MAPNRTPSTSGRRSRPEPEMPVFRVGGRVRCIGKTLGKGNRQVASSRSATTLRDPRPDPMNAFRSPPLLDKSEKNVAEPASGQTLHQPVVSSPKNLHYSQRDTIWVREQCDWGITLYTRMNIQRYFQTYPHVGGPFHGLGEVSNAIHRYLHDRQDSSMCKERHEFCEVGKASMERGIRACLYWPDGSKKMHLISEQIDERRCKMLQLVRALMDKYKEDHLLFEDTAFELKEVVGYKVIYDGNCRYYHINFTTKTIGAKTTDNLFFAEVIRREDVNLMVSCTCMVDPFDNGHCYGCGSNMKHPNADAYIGGHSKVYKVCHVGELKAYVRLESS